MKPYKYTIRIFSAVIAVLLAWRWGGPFLDVGEIFFHDLIFCFLLAIIAGFFAILNPDPKYNALVFSGIFFVGMNGVNIQLMVFHKQLSFPLSSFAFITVIAILIYLAVYWVNKLMLPIKMRNKNEQKLVVE